MLKMELKSSVMLGLAFVFAFQAMVNADGTLTFRDGIDGYSGRIELAVKTLSPTRYQVTVPKDALESYPVLYLHEN